MAPYLHNFRDDPVGDLGLRSRHFPADLPLPVQQQDPVGHVPETARGSDLVDGEEVGALADGFAPAEFGDGGGVVPGFRAEADDDLPGPAALEERSEE